MHSGFLWGHLLRFCQQALKFRRERTFKRERLVEWFSQIVKAVDDVYGTHYYDHDNEYSMTLGYSLKERHE